MIQQVHLNRHSHPESIRLSGRRNPALRPTHRSATFPKKDIIPEEQKADFLPRILEQRR